jgi:hypothetical protein
VTLIIAAGTSGQVLLSASNARIHGIVTRIESPRLRLGIRTEEGRSLDLVTANVDALRTVQAGDHVSIEVDGHGIAVNIRRTLPTPRPVWYSRG